MKLVSKRFSRKPKKKNKSDTNAEKQGLFSLEQRIVFDAAAPAAITEFAETTAAESGYVAPDTDPVADFVAALNEPDLVETDDTRNEIVFIDASVEDVQSFVSGIDGRAEVVLLDPQEDGVLQIADILSTRTDVDSIHIISHGTESTLELGAAQLDPNNLSMEHEAALSIFANILNTDSTIHFYGSEFGTGEQGIAAIDALAQATGADINATLQQIVADAENDVDTATIVANVLATPGENADASIVFVDQNLENLNDLLSNIDPQYEVVLIDSATDGVEQIAATLEGRTDLAAIHILSHGEEGRLFLGDATLDSASMRGEHADELSVIGQALSEDGDILIYGCDFTAGAEGLEAAILLGGMTRADIAASRDGTGHINRGGDWELEERVGDIDAESLAVEEWEGLMAPAITIAEDSSHTLTASDFSTSGSFTSITISSLSLPAGASLTLSGAAVSVNDTITLAQINAGNLVFTPATNDNGTTYATIDYDVNSTASSINILRGEASNWTLGNNGLTPSNVRIADTNLFGPTGTVTTSINLVGTSTNINAAYLAQGDVYFDGFVPQGRYSAAELSALDTWVQDGGTMISTNDHTSYDGVSTHFGLPIGGYASSVWSVADDTNPIMNGPFGSVGSIGDTFRAGGTIGYFNPAGLQAGDQVLAYDNGNTSRPTIVLRAHGDGWILFMSDEGPLRSSTSSGTGMTTANDILIGNIFAWAAGQGGSAPTSDSVSFNVTPVNDAPTVTSAIPNQANADDTNVSLSTSSAFTDVDGDTLTYSVTGLPAGLSINAATGVISGTIDNSASQSGPYTVVVTADDGNGGTGSDTFNWTITNPAPTVTAATADQTGVDDTAVSLNASAAFADVDGDTLTYSATGLPAGLSMNATTGVISGTIDNSASQAGPYTVVVTADDGEGGTVTDEFIWTITNPGPAAVADALTTAEDTVVSGNVSSNDSDVDGDSLTYSQLTNPSNGSVSFNANGTFTYTPATNFNGTDTFTYEVNDGEGGTDTATVTITVTAVNDAPEIGTVANQTNIDGQAITPFTVTSSDVDGDTLTYSATNLPTGLTINSATGEISGTIDNSASMNSPWAVQVTVSDGSLTDTVSFSWTVTNPTPTATVDTFTTDEDAAVSGNVLTNDTDPDGDNLTAQTTLVTNPTNGSVSLATDGTFTYTPADNFHGTDTFTYRISDGEGGFDEAVVTIEVDAVADAPLIGYEFDGTDIIYALDSTNAFPTTQISAEFTFQSDPAHTSVSLLSYAVPGSNNELLVWLSSNSVHIYLNGTGYSAPLASDGEVHRVSFTYDSTLTSDNLVVYVDGESVATHDVTSGALDAGGGITFGQEQDSVLSSFQSSQAFVGTLYSADIHSNILTAQQISDNSAGNGDVVAFDFSQLNNFQVDGAPASAIPVFTRGEVTSPTTITNFDATLEDNGTITLDLRTALSDTDGSETLSTVVSAIPIGVTLSDGAGNSFTSTSGTTSIDVSSWTLENIVLTPIADSDADITLIITATSQEASNNDTASVSSEATFVIKAVADKPTLTTSDDAAVQDTAIDLSDNLAGILVDTDGSESLSYQISNIPTGSVIQVSDGAGGTTTLVPVAGAVTLSETQRASLQFLPPNGFYGTITLDVVAVATEAATGDQVETATADSDVEQIVLTITNPAPVVSTPIADQNDVDAAGISLDVSTSFTDPDVNPDTLSYSVTGLPAGLSIDAATGVISGTIDNSASQAGPYTVVVTADDGEGGTVTDEFTWTITNPAPTVTAATADQNGVDDTAVSLDTSAAFNDVDGDTLSYSVTGLPAGLSIDAATGVISGTIDNSASQAGPYTVVVTADDGEGGTVTDEFTWTITNPAPTVTAATADQNGVDDTAVSLDTSAAFNDVDGDTLSYSVTGLPAGLTIDAATGVISGTIDNSASQAGPYTVVVTADDGEGGTVTDEFTWTITNPAPTVTAATADQNGVDDTAVSLDTSAAFNDVDGDTLSYSVTGLPAGLSIDAATGVISGTIDNSASQAGPYTVVVTADDGEGGTVTDEFTWTITNPAPTVTAATADQNGVDDTAVSLDTSAAFNDVDADTLSYSVTGLPAGLSIDAATGVISGTIDNSASQAGPYTVVVTADDGEGGTVTDEFTWTITNPAPTVTAATADQNGVDDTAVSLDTSAAFNDVDGDTLSYSVTGLPAGLSIDAATGVISGTIDNSASQAGPYTVVVTADDGEGGTVTDEFTWTITNPAPTVTAATADQNGVDDTAVSLDTSAAFNDVDGDTLSYSVTGLPAGLSIDAATGVISGTIDNSASQAGPYTVVVTADDGEGGTVTDEFTWTITNPAPTVTAATADQNGVDDTAVSLDTSAAFNDVDADTLSYSVTGLPAGLSIDAATGVISGTIDNSASQAGPYTVVVTADDGEGGTVTDEFTWTITNPAPTVTAATADQNGVDDTAVSLDTSAAFNDVDGDTLSYSVTGLPAGLSIDAATGVISGTIDNSASQAGPYTVVVTADDGEGGTVTDEFTWTITNPAPTVTAATADQNGVDDTAVSLDTSAAFNDVDADTLSYSVTGLPAGLSIDAATGVISGTIDNSASQAGPYTVVVTADDGEGGTVTDEFTWTITNPAPTVTAATADQNGVDDTAVSLDTSAAFNDVDGDTLSYSVTGLPAGLSIDAATGVISGTIDNSASQAGPYTVVVTADDGEGGTVTDEFTWTITNPAPTVTAATADQNGVDDTAVSLDTSAAFNDVDGDTLSYSVTGLPAGLSIDAATGVISGTIDNSASQAGPYTVVVTADDGEGGTVTDEFTWTITNPAPTVTAATADQNGVDDTAVSLDTSAAFNDVDADTLSYSVTGLPAGLSIDAATGVISGTIDNSASQAGPYTVIVTADDGEGGTVTDEFTWTITNPGPAAVADTLTTAEDTVVSGNVSANDSDVDGDDLTYSQLTNPSNGSVSFNANGTFTYTPATNFNGTDTFTYEVSDGEGGTDTATVTITVTAVNDAPEIGTVANQTNIDGQAITPFTVTSSDVDGDTLTYSATNLPTGLTIDSATGEISGTVDNSASLNSPWAVQVTVSDGSLTDTVSFSWTVTNPAPTATVDTFTTDEDTAVSGDVLTNDTDPDGDDLTAQTTLVTNPANGSVSLATDGTFTYTPADNFHGTDTFTYRISDGEGGFSEATVTVTVDAVADAPLIGYEFNGGDILYVEDTGNAFPTDTFTADIVFQRDNATSSMALFSYAVPGQANEVLIYQSGSRVDIWIGGVSRVISLPVTTDIQHLTVTFDASAASDNLNVYSDGVLMGTRDLAVSSITSGGALVFGQEQDGYLSNFSSSQEFDGTLYSVNIYDGVLSQSEIVDSSAGPGDIVSLDFSNLDNTTVTGDPSSAISAIDRGNVIYPNTIVPYEPTVEDFNSIILDLRTSVEDNSTSENLSTVISAIPIGVSISDGAGNNFTSSAGNTSIDISGWTTENIVLTPLADDDTDITLLVTATTTEPSNGDTATTESQVTFVIKAVADKPTLTTSDDAAVQDTAIDLSDNLAGILVDTDGSESLSYQISNIPTGSVIQVSDGAGGTTTLVPVAGAVTLSETQRASLQFLPPNGFYGTITLDVVAVATEAATGDQVETATADSDVEQIVLTITNPAPVVSTPIADQNDVDAAGISLDVSTSFTDPDVNPDTLSYSVTGLPAGLSIDAATGVISGTIDNSASQAGPYTVVVTADDGEGGTVTDEFTWTITNPAPTVTAATADQNGVDDTAVSLDTSAAFNDVDGDTLSYSVTGLPAGLSIDAATGVISGTIDNSASQAGPYTVVVTADDGEGGTVTDEFTWTITNPAPTVTAATADQNGVDDTAVSLDTSAAFNDVDGDTLSYSVTGLPAGLTIDAATGVISGTIDNSASQAGPYTVVVTADDGEGGTVTDEFTWTITNPAPTVTAATADQNGVDDTAVSLDTSAAFNDVDGDTLSYSVTGLPAGLSIDAATGVISGTIDNSASQAGPYTVVVTADDGEGGTVTDEFTWTITNPAPTVTAATADQNGVDDTAVSLDTSAAFNDVDADTLSYSVTGLPAGLSIDAATGVISGTIDNSASQAGPYTVVVTADDGEGGTVTDEFTWTITNPAPTVTAATADQNGVDDTAVSLDTSAAFNDVDGDTLSYSVTGLPAGLSIDAATGVISGTIDNSASQAGPYTVVVTADDGEGGTVTDEFTWTITNPAPTVTAATADQNGVDDTAVSLDTSAAFNDVDGDTLSYSVTGLPAGLSIDAATGVISGTIDNSASQAGPYTVVVTADDGEGGTVTDEFTWTITNPAPTVTAATADQNGVDDTAVSLDTSAAFNDVDADTLSYSVTGLPAGLSIDAATGVISGTIDNSASQAGPYTVIVTADDGEGGTVTDEFTWTITNPGPAAVADTLTTAEDTVVSGNVSANDSDVDGDDLTYSQLTNPSNGSVSFNANGTFTYTPATNFNGTDTFTYEVSDGEGGTDTATVTITVTAVNDAPEIGTVANQTNIDGQAITPFTVTSSDVDGDTLTYSATNLPTGLTIDSATGEISGTVDNSASLNSPWAVQVTVSDGSLTDTVSFSWTVTNPAPTATVDTFTTDEDTAVSGDVLTNDTDPDGDDLTAQTTLVTNPANGSVSLATDGTFTYTPADNFHGTDTFTYRISDGEGGFSEATVTVTVDAVNDLPTVAAPIDDQVHLDDQSVSIATAQAFDDLDGDTLTYSVSGLPAGLSIDTTTGVISGTIDNSASQFGPYSVTVTASDGNGGTVSDTFGWTVTNQDPNVTTAIADQNNSDSEPINLPVSGSFADPDNDTFTFSATGLPPGLTIDGATGIISGTLTGNASQGGPAGDGVYEITVQADDGEGGVTTDTFTWAIENVPPVTGAPLPDVVYDDAQSLSINASNAFTNSDNDTLTFTVTGLPASLSIDANTGIISGTLDNSDSLTSPYTIQVTVSDGQGGTANDTFTLTVNNPGPTVSAPIADLTSDDAEAISLPTAGAFNDIDGDDLTFTAGGLPAGLSIDPTTGLISGTIDNSASLTSPYSITVTVNDGEGGTVSDTFTWTVLNPAPVVDTIIIDQTGLDSDTVSLDVTDAFTDSDADTLTYSVTGLPEGLSIDQHTGVISGTIDSDASGGGLSNDGQYTVTVTADDGEGGTTSDTFIWSVTNVAPTVVDPLSNLTHEDQQTLSVNTASAFNDPDGDTLTYLATGLPPGLEINTTTGVIFGTIDNSASVVGSYTIVISASDGTSSVTDTFNWTVTNPAPVVTDGINDQSSIDAETVSIDASQAFSDPDNDVLTYSASGLPAGLTINSETGMIAGIVDNSASQFGPYTITVTADDGEGGVVTDTFTWQVSNPLPIAGDDVNATSEDNSVTGNVLINDTDPDGDALSALTVLVQEPSNGTVSLSASGEYTYTPDPDFNGTDTFVYTVSDGEGGTDTATVEITVTAVNDAPVVAQALENQIAEDSDLVSINVSGAFSDIEGDTLNYSASGLPAGLTLNATTGEISGTIDHSASVNAPYTVTILASDGNGGAVSTTFIWRISNPAPEANDDTVSTTEDIAVSGNLLSNDSDPDGDSLSAIATPIVMPNNGTVSISSDGTFTYTPNLNFNGSDQFTYLIIDNEGGYSEATVNVTVIADNDAPEIQVEIPDQTYFDADDVSLDITTNFGDVDGNVLTYSVDTLPPGLTLDSTTGIISGVLTSDASQTGPYEVTITAVDPDGLSVSDTFTIEVNNRNPIVDSPIADLSASDADSVSIQAANSFTDVDHDTLVFTASGLPVGLSIDPHTGVISGTLEPDASVNGVDGDGRYVIIISVDDEQGGTISDEFVLQVSNQDPSATIPIGPQNHEDSETVSIDVTNNFANPDNDVLTYSATGLPPGLSIDPDTGLISGIIDSDASQSSVPYQVTIQVDDGQGTASQSFEWSITNPAPIVHTEIDDQSGYDTQPVSIDTSNFFVDPDADVLSYSASGLPDGLVFDAATGLISGVIDHSASVDGPYTVTITANDGQGGSVTDTFTWTVQNLDPTAQDNTIESVEDGNITGSLTPLVNDPDGDNLTASLHTAPEHGTVEIRSDGTYLYIPDADFNGTDSFIYLIDDQEGGTATGIITLNIAADNDAPVTSGTIANTTLVDGQAGINIPTAGIFSDVDGDTLTYSAANLPEGLSIDPSTGEIVGTVDGSASLIGPYPIIITATDGNGSTVTSQFTISVDNAPPEAIDDTISVDEDVSIDIDVLSNDLSPDGDTLNVVVASASNGTVVINSDGTLTYTPHADFNGEDTITYTVSDGEGGNSTAVVSVSVIPGNDVPVTTGSLPQYNLSDSEPGINIDTSVIFSDTDNDALTYSVTNLPEGLSIDPATGIITGTVGSSASGSGPYTIVITVDDGNGGTATSEFVIAVANPAPVAVDDANATSEDVAVSGNVLDNDSDPDGDQLVVSTDLVSEPQNGIVTLDESGNYTYTPNNDFAGTDTFTYTVTDSDGTTATADVTVTVTAVNDPPVITTNIEGQSGTINGSVSFGVEEFVTDIDSTDLTFEAIGLPPGLTINPDTGEISGVITSAASTSSPYTVTLTISDGNGGSVTTQFTWSVVNRDPTATDHNLTTTEDTPITGDGLAGTSDLDDDSLVVITTPVVQPEHGTVLINASGAYTYIPDPNFYGSDQFTYQVIDNRGGAVEVTVYLDISSQNDAPDLVSTPNGVTAEEGDSVSISVAENFIDVDEGDTLTFTAEGLPPGLTIDPVTGVISGEIKLNASGNGPYTVTITADDGNGGTVSVTFEIDVTPSVQNNFDPNGSKDDSTIDSLTSGFDASQNSAIDTGGSGIVGETVNNIRTLGLNYDIQTDHPVSRVVNQIEQLHQFMNSASAEYGSLIGNWDVQALNGFSLSTDVMALDNGLPDQSIGHIAIEGFQFERVLYLQITDALPVTEVANTARYNVTMSDGSPLPNWVDYSQQGLVLLHHPVGIDAINLKIEIVLASDETIEQFISVDILNAQVSLLDKSTEENQHSQINDQNPSMFASQAEKEISSLEKDKLFKALFE